MIFENKVFDRWAEDLATAIATAITQLRRANYQVAKIEILHVPVAAEANVIIRYEKLFPLLKAPI